ncbi:aminoacyl-tRNA deacylase [Gordonia soli]|uniref:Cys-tRNA(Pro)/Cys-tRNA(Cys) deacylase n=1 Tax=Gordonia soli NBRC 108243 TaxID=1223545 RepID=M0QDE5_9ACTN|nr:aminoacyl-tRNA deacylase [Gordonia soli]GAC66633.1 putative aminoacyl-tRNA deacylase [Gordonia soli NBRC 108243]
MAATPAIAALEKAGIAHDVHRYGHDPRSDAYGDEAVAVMTERLGVAPEQILKTLVIDLGSTLAVAVLPVPARLSVKAAAAALGSSKAVMAQARDVTRSTGYVLGGVSPVGQRTRLPTVVDESALAWPMVLCSGGRRGVEIALAPTDLVAVTDAVTASVLA